MCDLIYLSHMSVASIPEFVNQVLLFVVITTIGWIFVNILKR